MANSFPVRITQDGFPVNITDIPNNWIPIGTNVNKGGPRITTSQTSRTLCIPPLDVNALRLVYSNFYTGGVGETPNTNKILVRASIQPMGSSINEGLSDPIYRVTFGGNDSKVIASGGLLISDPIPITFLTNTKFFIKSYGTPIGGNAPSALSFSISGTGSSLNGTYSVCVTIVYGSGFESSPSVGTLLTVPNGQNINITSPISIVGAIGYRVWQTYNGGTAESVHYDSGLGVINFGTNAIITGGLASTAAQNIEQVDPSGILYLSVGGGVAGGTTGYGCNLSLIHI